MTPRKKRITINTACILFYLFFVVAKINPFCEALFEENDACDFFTKQAKLQIEARMALCQAKDMAHMQMEVRDGNANTSPLCPAMQKANV